MPEVVDPNTGQVVNQSQRKTLQDTVKKEAEAVANDTVDQFANTAKNTFENATQSISGQVSGAVNGGIQSLGSKIDGYKQEFTQAKDDVTGLLSGDAQSLDNLKTKATDAVMSAISSKLGTKVKIEYEEVDGIVKPVKASLEGEPGAGDTIAGVLSLITGLGASIPPDLSQAGLAKVAENFQGELQKAVIDASPKGLVGAANLLQGKVGAFTSESINSLANNVITNVTNEVEGALDTALAAGANLNKTVSYVDSFDSDGAGNLTTTTDTVSTQNGGPDTPVDGGRTDSDLTALAIGNIKTNGLNDVATLINKDIEIKQNIEGTKKDLAALTGKDGAVVLDAVNKETEAVDAYAQRVSEYKTRITQKVAGGSQTGIVQGINNNTLSSIREDIAAFSPGITPERIEEVIALSQGDDGDKSNAVRLLVQSSGKDYNTVKVFVDKIDTTIENSVRAKVNVQVLEDPYEIGEYFQNWNDGKDDPKFPYISSVEELQAEAQFVSREIESVIVHWTETATNKNIGSEEINGWHLKAGLKGIGYHYVIRRDGSLQRARPVNIEGQHTPGFDDKTIGVVFVGGINAPSETPNAQNFLSAKSLTRSQINTFDQICKAFYRVWPGIQFKGHADVDATGQNIDPGFDVPDYVLTRFGKSNAEAS